MSPRGMPFLQMVNKGPSGPGPEKIVIERVCLAAAKFSSVLSHREARFSRLYSLHGETPRKQDMPHQCPALPPPMPVTTVQQADLLPLHQSISSSGTLSKSPPPPPPKPFSSFDSCAVLNTRIRLAMCISFRRKQERVFPVNSYNVLYSHRVRITLLGLRFVFLFRTDYTCFWINFE